MMSIGSALLIHGGALGDFVLSLRIVQALQRAGARRIVMLARAEHEQLAIRGGADEFWNLDTGGFHTLFSQNAAPPAEIAGKLATIDLAVDMLGGSAFAQRLLQFGVKRVVTVDPRPRENRPLHITDQWLNELRDAGVESVPGPPCIAVTQEERRRYRERLVDMIGHKADTILLLHPGSGSRAKCWPTERFAELGDKLRAEACAVVMALGPVEAERMTADEMKMLSNETPIIRPRQTTDLSISLAAVDAYVGNDSGVSHLAASVGTPTVAIFGPTDPRIWAPLGEHVCVMRSPTARAWPDVEDVFRGAVLAARRRARA